MKQHEITKRHPLLDENGHLIEAGYAKSLILDYDRKMIKAPSCRIKEWDYYYVGNDKYGVALTIDDNSYMGLDSVSFLDFRKEFAHTVSKKQLFTFGKKKLPSTSKEGNIKVIDKNYFISFEKYPGRRVLTFEVDDFYMESPISGEITLLEEPMDSMVIATPFKDKPTYFYYNQKINCMRAKGVVRIFGEDCTFEPDTAMGVLDWGRGVWTYKNTWYWGSASGMVNGHKFGFNIGYGFGDTSAATENMLFYDNKAHKLSEVKFNIPMKNGKEDYMSPWTFSSSDKRFEMSFKPIVDRADNTNFIFIGSNQHQVFGKFTGTAVLDDGTKIKIKNFVGFAEKVSNKW